MSTISPEQLAVRARQHGVRIDGRLALSFLERWRAQGIAEEIAGRWRLTKQGRAMFAVWVGKSEAEETAA